MLCALAAGASPAFGARVIVLSADGHATARNDPFLPAATPLPSPAAAVPASIARASKKPPKRKPPSVHSDLRGFDRLHVITDSAFRDYSTILDQAIGSKNRLKGSRQDELESVLANMHALALEHEFTPSRLPVLFQTLARNRQWWTSGPLLASGERVEFAGSQLVWEYYPGQGLELQELGSFGKADGLYAAGPKQYPAMEQLLAELIPLAAQRGRALAWEYYFSFDGGSPPWTSAMSQGTAIEALTRAYEASHNPAYLNLAHRALELFELAPPTGVRVGTSLGAWYVQYSFAPGAGILNAFLQSLIGLYDYAQVSGDPLAKKLFAAGNAEAQAEVPHFDTGARRRGLALLPRARHRLPRAAVLADRGERLLHGRQALRGVPEDAACADPADHPRARQARVLDRLPPVEDLARGRRRARSVWACHVRNQRLLPVRRALVRDPCAEAQGDVHDPPRGN
jgi:hypothetical protein